MSEKGPVILRRAALSVLLGIVIESIYPALLSAKGYFDYSIQGIGGILIMLQNDIYRSEMLC